MARYRRQPDKKDPYKAQPLPVERPVAVYYRQSTQAQIGNISTTLQTVDMVEHLVKLGWTPEHIIMIDMDAGISGSKKINERPGMSQLFQMIEHQQISAVAAQDVDRFFRDVTQIEPNIFIDACRRNNV
ncbi:MAG: recombinase family protein, partial [Taibaiella sp.]|nr:recombinase family protein [Taibaiella sp.]